MGSFCKLYPVAVLIIAVWLAHHIEAGPINKKLGQLREKHEYFSKIQALNKTRVSSSRRHTLLRMSSSRPSETLKGLKQNNTKREYVYYPDGGQHGHFQGFHSDEGFDDCGDDCGGGGNVGNDCLGDGCDDMSVPEFTHTHHVVKYHHHVGEFLFIFPTGFEAPALKIQCHVVQNTPLQTAFLAILPTGFRHL